MVATADALIFVFILALVSVSVISIHPSEPDTPDASEVCDSLSLIRLDAGVMVGGTRSTDSTVWDLAAASLSSGDTAFIEGYLDDVIRDILSGRYGYELVITHKERMMTVGDGAGTPTSECSRTYAVIGGGSVSVILTIY